MARSTTESPDGRIVPTVGDGRKVHTVGEVIAALNAAADEYGRARTVRDSAAAAVREAEAGLSASFANWYEGITGKPLPRRLGGLLRQRTN